jgi:hypothetical protein
MTDPAETPQRRRRRRKARRSSLAGPGRPAPRTRDTALLLTNGGKLVGFVIAVNETVIRDNLRESALLIAGLLVLGSQAAEDVVLHAIDRFFARQMEPADDEE